MEPLQALILTLGFVLATLPVFYYQNYLDAQRRCKALEEKLTEEHEKTKRLELALEQSKITSDSASTPTPKTEEDESKAEKNEVLDGILKTLNENQRQIIDLLLASKDRKTKQIEIFHETGISKSTLSYELKNLSARNLVLIKNAGRTNIIELADWVKK
ncbi:MAG: hypothetical protein ABH950_04435 [Candidatus Altiarchaeota archaeon]